MSLSRRSLDLPVEETEWRKYRVYDLSVDHNQNDKAKEIKLCSSIRPHMRAFHCAWFSFFTAFFVWFALSPLLPEIKASLGLTKSDVWNSSIAGVLGTVLVRLLVGPLCDTHGPRVLMAAILCLSAVPTACTGLVQTATHLAILRLFIGIAGGTFVMCQFWSTSMFTLEIVGTANGLVGGWGNVGAGFSNMVMGSLLFPLFKFGYDGDAEKAWRTVCVVPAIAAVCTGVYVYRFSDDTTRGNYSEMKRRGYTTTTTMSSSFYAAVVNINTWVLAVQYACCFGVQLTMNNAAAMYFKDQFGLSTASASAIASIFSWILLFARALGGFTSDVANAKYGMQGRIMVQTCFLVCEGAFVILFSHTKSLESSIIVMIVFSLFVDAATGSSFGIVPYINPECTGSIMGVVGAGGNVGAVIFGLLFRDLPYERAFFIMGAAAAGSGLLSAFINIEGQSHLFSVQKTPVDDGEKLSGPSAPGKGKTKQQTIDSGYLS